MKFSIWGFLFSYIIFIKGVEGIIRCYVCTTQTGQYKDRCGDQFKLTSESTSYCEGSCFKTRGYRKDGGRDVPEVTRGCFPAQEERCYDGNQNGISATVCTCNEDLCNSGPPVVPKWTTLIVGLCSVFLKLLFMF